MSRKTVLVVDDEPLNIKILAEILMPNYRVLGAKTAEKALELAGAKPKPDIILLDVILPESSGYEICQKLKQLAKTRDIPVIFVTSVDQVHSETRGLALGAVDYLVKPVIPDIVLARVDTHIKLSEAKRKLDSDLLLTLHGTSRILSEILAATRPQAYARSLRLKEIVGRMLTAGPVSRPWLYEITASLSQLGCVYIPSVLLNKIEAGEAISASEIELYRSYPKHSYELLINLPHLEECARLIEGLKVVEDISLFRQQNELPLAETLLQGAVYFDEQSSQLKNPEKVVREMAEVFPETVVNGVKAYIADRTATPSRHIDLSELEPGMVAGADVCSDTGSILIPRGCTLTTSMISRLRQHWKNHIDQQIAIV